MFKKNKKQTETIKEPKEKKVRTVKVGTHKKTVIALWVVLIASVSFGVYKNFTAIDQHTTHEKEIIELRLQDTNGIENFVKNFAKSYYTWSNSKEAIEARTQANLDIIWFCCRPNITIFFNWLSKPTLSFVPSISKNATYSSKIRKQGGSPR